MFIFLLRIIPIFVMMLGKGFGWYQEDLELYVPLMLIELALEAIIFAIVYRQYRKGRTEELDRVKGDARVMVERKRR